MMFLYGCIVIVLYLVFQHTKLPPQCKKFVMLVFFQMNKLQNIGDLKLNTGTSIEPINNDNINPNIHGSEQQTAVFL